MMEMGVERELRDLKQETSKLKLKIPFNLIAPEYQPAADPNVILQPRTRPSEATSSNSIVVVDNDELVDPFSRYRPFSNSDRSPILRCFLAFPEGAFIKASLLCSYVNATVFALQKGKLTVLEDIVLTASELVSEGFIKSVSKKHSSTSVYGFWMDPSVRHALKEHLYRESFLRRGVKSLVNSTSINGEDIIYSGSADVSTLSSDVEFLHLGKWQSYPTHHIEMPDPNLYFKNTGPLLHLTYISFRGVSVMKELPNILTHSRYLMILDLKACHHLQVLPSNIGKLWGWLAHLDMSECYFLDHMPSSLSRLTGLHVLKGFFVGETNNDEECCTLQDLSSMEYLKKLNIYTSLKTFPNENHLTTLQGFEHLCNLTICWGGCPTRVRNRELRKSPAIRLKRLVTRGPDHTVVRVDKKFSFSLEKLDLRGAPEMGTRNWLRPSNFEKLQKLYIRGGQLSHLKNNDEAQKDKQLEPVKEKGWSVKMLRLRHLSKLQMDWSELQDSFPNVVCLEKVECPNLTSFPCDDDGLWSKDNTQPPADESEERHGISICQRGPVECENIAVEIFEQTAE